MPVWIPPGIHGLLQADVIRRNRWDDSNKKTTKIPRVFCGFCAFLWPFRRYNSLQTEPVPSEVPNNEQNRLVVFCAVLPDIQCESPIGGVMRESGGSQADRYDHHGSSIRRRGRLRPGGRWRARRRSTI